MSCQVIGGLRFHSAVQRFLPVKDYSKYKPEGFEEKDIYVCEWRYSSKLRNWKKIKVQLSFLRDGLKYIVHLDNNWVLGASCSHQDCAQRDDL